MIETNSAVSGIVLETDGIIAAYAFYWITSGELHIANIAVDGRFRRNKLGERVLHYIMEHACAGESAVYAVLEVRESNIPAIRLYEKFGFGVLRASGRNITGTTMKTRWL